MGKLYKRKIKNISKFYVNNQEYNLNIKLFAQGQGVWQDHCFENGIIENGYDVVIDIGYRTNDVIVFKDGKTNKSESSADDKGINQITTEIQTVLNKRFDVVLTEQEVALILKAKPLEILSIKL